MDTMPSIDKESDGSECAEPFESDTVGPSSTSGASELKNNNRDFLIHKVTRNDTLAGLAIRYGLSVYDIKKANGLTDDRAIFGRESEALVYLNGVKLVAPRTSLGDRWSSFVAVNDSDDRLLSEIELELLDEDTASHRRRAELMQWHRNLYSRPSRPPVAPKASSGSISEYVTSMAASWMKTTESFFSGDGSSGHRSMSLFQRMKSTASQSSLLSGMGLGKRQEETGMGSRVTSEGNLSVKSGKESMKMD